MQSLPINSMRRAKLLCMTHRLGLVSATQNTFHPHSNSTSLSAMKIQVIFSGLVSVLSPWLHYCLCPTAMLASFLLQPCWTVYFWALATCTRLGVPCEAKALGLSGRGLGASSPGNEQTLTRCQVISKVWVLRVLALPLLTSLPSAQVWPTWMRAWNVRTSWWLYWIV